VQRIQTTTDLRDATAVWREAGDRIALVPTMGNLHRGHMSLVELAAQHAEHVIVSVFVNPTQFGPGEDFGEYPRTLEIDARRLSRAGVDVLFVPEVEDMYPVGLDAATRIHVPKLSEQLCGEFRPGHFEGVTSVVCRLLNICSPSVAVFGQKDYQQYVILQRMVEDLHLPVRLLAGATEREANGLAKSSRNTFLDEAEQARAGIIFSALTQAATTLAADASDPAAIERAASEQIAAEGLVPEYVSVLNSADLNAPTADDHKLVILAAARLGKVRLIDNVTVTVNET
jgi:pantoate--beta-alanine ligase